MSDSDHLLRRLPSVDALLATPRGEALRAELSHGFVAGEARRLVDGWRRDLLSGKLATDRLDALLAAPGAALDAAVAASLAPSLCRVINATGVVIHTNLGRAPWPAGAIDQAMAVARGYSNLEYDLVAGRRGRRETHLDRAAAWLGAEAALVVNNCAAALVLVLNTLADRQDCIVSRGELVEIGGSFRLPEILARSGARLCEVGTTNRTRLEDYQAAVGDDTGLLLKVHPSNFRVLGFTHAVRIAELVSLGRQRGVPVVEDLGSGQAVALDRIGVGHEPTISSSLAAGVDAVLFSGDKLLGGPQSGIILGRQELVRRLRGNPLYRALRPDKVTIAALFELLQAYRTRDPWRDVPVLRMLAATPEELAERSRRLAARFDSSVITAEVIAGQSAVGGGAAPLARIPSTLIAITPSVGSAAAMERALRAADPPVIARIEEGRVLVDLRTVEVDQEEELIAALTASH